MIRVRQVKVPILENSDESLLSKISLKIHVPVLDILSFQILQKSIDARDKKSIFYVYEVALEVVDESKILKKNYHDVLPYDFSEYSFVVSGKEEIQNRIVIVGSGPAGLFCAYLLAEAGYAPLVLERGECIEERVETVSQFFESGILNENSNISFGEGGAGTFSDGKLNTMVKDKMHRGRKVFEIFVENGAPEEILYLSKPHIGTDLLRNVIVNMRRKILSMGGEIRFCSQVTDILFHHDKVCGVVVNQKEEIPCDVLVLAIGHSARDTMKMLYEKKLRMSAKNFAVGVRVCHPQEMINHSQYGEMSKYLPPASYKLTYQTKSGRGVYSFCMCPGGFVINASSEKEHLVVNGMSNHKRDETTGNSALVVTVSKEDFGNDIFAGMEFQKDLEKKAYEACNGKIPVQLFGDFQKGIGSTSLGEVTPNTKGDWDFSNMWDILPSFICESLLEAMPDFGRKIKGFDRSDALFLGVETRTSSPIFIERGVDGVSNLLGIYPCGEGAGYAGGITTAAMDGIKIAEAIGNKYRPFIS